MRSILFSFLAGFLATLVFHQPVLWLFRLAGLTDRAPYALTPVPPLGIPAVISLSFWGGVWGIVMIPAIARCSGPWYWIAAIVFGAVLPTLVAFLVVMPLKHMPRPPADKRVAMLLLGLSVNAAWGLGTALFYRLFSGWRG